MKSIGMRYMAKLRLRANKFGLRILSKHYIAGMKSMHIALVSPKAEKLQSFLTTLLGARGQRKRCVRHMRKLRCNPRSCMYQTKSYGFSQMNSMKLIRHFTIVRINFVHWLKILLIWSPVLIDNAAVYMLTLQSRNVMLLLQSCNSIIVL